MWKRIVPLLIIILFSFKAKSQVLTQTYIDPCDGKSYVVVFPLNNSVITVVVRGKMKSFTYYQAQTGELTTWVNSIFATPCPVSVAAAQTQTQVATSVAKAAASAAAAAAAAPPPMAPVAPPPAAPAPAPAPAPAASSSSSGSGGGSSSSSSSSSESKSSSSSESKSEGGGGESKSESKSEESKSESKSEEKKEESKSEEKKSEEKKEEKKSESKKDSKKDNKQKQQRVNPLMMSSDLTTAQTPDNKYTAIMNFGVSKNSLAGDKSYGATAMVWSTLDQFALSTRYTKITFNDRFATTVSNTSLTTAYAQGNVFLFLGYSEVLAKPKFGVFGYNTNLGAMFLTGGTKSYLASFTMFYMRPIVVNKKLSVTPAVFASGTPLLYSQKQLSVDTNLGLMTGATFDYTITKKFKFGFDYKVSFGTMPDTPVLSMIMIGSKLQL